MPLGITKREGATSPIGVDGDDSMKDMCILLRLENKLGMKRDMYMMFPR